MSSPESDSESDSDFAPDPVAEARYIASLNRKRHANSIMRPTLRQGRTMYTDLVEIVNNAYTREQMNNIIEYTNKGDTLNSQLRAGLDRRSQTTKMVLTNSLQPLERLFPRADYIKVYRDQTQPWRDELNQGFVSTSQKPIATGAFGSVNTTIYVPTDIPVGMADISHKGIPQMIEVVLPTSLKMYNIGPGKLLVVSEKGTEMYDELRVTQNR